MLFALQKPKSLARQVQVAPVRLNERRQLLKPYDLDLEEAYDRLRFTPFARPSRVPYGPLGHYYVREMQMQAPTEEQAREALRVCQERYLADVSRIPGHVMIYRKSQADQIADKTWVGTLLAVYA